MARMIVRAGVSAIALAGAVVMGGGAVAQAQAGPQLNTTAQANVRPLLNTTDEVETFYYSNPQKSDWVGSQSTGPCPSYKNFGVFTSYYTTFVYSCT